VKKKRQRHMTNILEAINNISKLESLSVEEVKFGNNRATSIGEGLETFIKDAFANTFTVSDKKVRIDEYNKVFSYQGSKRTPPDLMLKDGDAIEVKKTETLKSELQLNSSHPKAKLKIDSTLINKHCKTCEYWKEKDFIYAVGHVPKGTNTLNSLWFIYGDLYAADEDVYLSLKETLTENFEQIQNIDFSETNEIGRINFVDPLKITNLRIRGMWLLQPPYKVFDYIHNYSAGYKFQCISLMSKKKYESFPETSISKIESNKEIKVEDVQVQDPNNPVNIIDSKLIRFKISGDSNK